MEQLHPSHIERANPLFNSRFDRLNIVKNLIGILCWRLRVELQELVGQETDLSGPNELL